MVALVLVSAAPACAHVEYRKIDGKDWELWGEDKQRYRAMIYAQPPPGTRCDYWRDLIRDLDRDRPVELLGVFEIASLSTSENLRMFVAAAERDVCAAETRHASSAR
jgi:hypothetical protein